MGIFVFALFEVNIGNVRFEFGQRARHFAGESFIERDDVFEILFRNKKDLERHLDLARDKRQSVASFDIVRVNNADFEDILFTPIGTKR